MCTMLKSIANACFPTPSVSCQVRSARDEAAPSILEERVLVFIARACSSFYWFCKSMAEVHSVHCAVFLLVARHCPNIVVLMQMHCISVLGHFRQRWIGGGVGAEVAMEVGWGWDCGWPERGLVAK